MIMVFVDGMILRLAEKPLAANCALRSVIVSKKSITFCMGMVAGAERVSSNPRW
jgi:hypothetical protein